MTTLIKELKENKIQFAEVIAFIEAEYNHTPAAFKNGDTFNEFTQNQGSAKVFAYAQLNNLSEEDTLLLFAEHYQSVLINPEGEDHQNIRQFIKNGWNGIKFEGVVLNSK
jgi:hypothetical protein